MRIKVSALRAVLGPSWTRSQSRRSAPVLGRSNVEAEESPEKWDRGDAVVACCARGRARGRAHSDVVYPTALAVILILCLAHAARAGVPPAEKPPSHYLCHYTDHPLVIDGRLDDPAWKQAPWTKDFQDIEGDAKPKPRFRTRVKMLWDDTYFYIAAELQEPHVWATHTNHDAVIFEDNDFEVFIDPDGDTLNYYEFEMNALNTGWDLLLDKPYKAGGTPKNEWEIPGLKTAVHINGTLNHPADKDTGWTLEIAFPWKVLAEYSQQSAPPRETDEWRVNFSRVEWLTEIVNGKYHKLPGKKEDNWVWSPQGLIDMHVPEKWGYVTFTRKKVAPPLSSPATRH